MSSSPPAPDDLAALRAERDRLDIENVWMRAFLHASCSLCAQSGCSHCRWLGARMGEMDGALSGEEPANEYTAQRIARAMLNAVEKAEAARDGGGEG